MTMSFHPGHCPGLFSVSPSGSKDTPYLFSFLTGEPDGPDEKFLSKENPGKIISVG